MSTVVIGCLIFCLTTAGSITLLGDRALLSGNLFSLSKIFSILIHWKFILSMTLAICARLSFIAINSALLRDEALAPSSTTVTTFVTASAYVVVVFSNYFFLGERLNLQQGLGAGLIILGITVLVK